MTRSANAFYIDAEYRRKQAYKKLKERQKCNSKKCVYCKFFDVCTNKE